MNGEDAGRLVYLDSSAIVKLIVAEPESPQLARFIEGAQLVSSRLAEIETRRAVRLAGAGRRISNRMEAVLEAVSMVEMTPEIARSAGGAGPPGLRTLDAIHLATALHLKDQCECVVAYDHRLTAAAADSGLAVESPGSAAR